MCSEIKDGTRARPWASPCCPVMRPSRSMEFSKLHDGALPLPRGVAEATVWTAMEWLTARPVAHRGLHDGSNIIENTASAFAAAIAERYGIECDLQISADGDAMVHHDEALGRLAEGSARLDAVTAAELKRTPFKAGTDRMITLGDLCDLTAGRTPLIIELKSHDDGDRRLVRRTTDVLSTYGGHAAVMSFDPLQVGMLREIAPGIVRGIVAERADQH